MKKKKDIITNIIAILLVVWIIIISYKIGNYLIDNKPKNNKGNVILFRH